MCARSEKEHLDKIIGKNIRNERESRHLLLEDLAKLLYLSSSHLSLIERGKRGTTSVTLAKLSKVLDISIDDLFSIYPDSTRMESPARIFPSPAGK